MANLPSHSTPQFSSLPRDVLAALSTLLVSMVWVPVASLAVLLLTGVTPFWNPALLCSTIFFFALAGLLFYHFPNRQKLWLILGLLAFTLTAAVICLCFYDAGYDGRWYHADAILALLNGFNPIHTSISGVETVYANHYPKATWYFAAFLIHFTHAYQLGKIYNLLLMLASGLYAFDFFLRHRLYWRDAMLLAAATALTPVAATQIVSYYVDGFFVALLTITILAGVNLLIKPERCDRLLLALTISLLVATKFTGLVYAAVLIVLLLAARTLISRHLPAAQFWRVLSIDLATATSALGFGLLVLGYTPYITNLRQGLSLMYPVIGKDKIDFMSITTPPALLGHGYNAIEKFLISFFAPTQLSSGATIPFKIPFSVHWHEIVCFGDPGVNVAGWGVFFSGLVLSTLALFLVRRAWRRNAPFLLVLLLIAASGFINPESWKARYSPQIGLLPVFFLAAVLCSKAKAQRWNGRLLTQMLCLTLIVNSLLCAGPALAASCFKSKRLNQQFSLAINKNGPGEYWIYRAAEVNVAKLHYEQFSGLRGVVLCGEITPRNQIPPGVGSPVWMNMRNETEATLVKGSCSQPPPY